MNSQDPAPLVRASFRKTISDGHYGTETCEVDLELPLEGGTLDRTAQALLVTARGLVQAELLRSPAPIVRRTLETQLQARQESAAVTVPPDDDDIPL